MRLDALENLATSLARRVVKGPLLLPGICRMRPPSYLSPWLVTWLCEASSAGTRGEAVARLKDFRKPRAPRKLAGSCYRAQKPGEEHHDPR